MRNPILRRKIVLLIIDIAVINFSFILSFYFRFLTEIPREYIVAYAENSIIITLIYILSFYFFRMYDSLWRYAGPDEFLLIFAACASSGIAVMAYNLIYGGLIPRSIIILGTILITLFISISRATFRTYRVWVKILEDKKRSPESRAMIVGAGAGGCMVLQEMNTSDEIKVTPVCFVDDDENKQGMTISRIKVLGNRHDIPRLVKELNIDSIVIAIPTISGADRSEIVNICKNTGCKLKIMPGIYELLKGEVTVKEIRDVHIEDLLGRDTVLLEDEGIKDYIRGKVVLIPGGGGSIGSEISRQVLKYGPKMLDNFRQL